MLAVLVVTVSEWGFLYNSAVYYVLSFFEVIPSSGYGQLTL